MSVRLETETDRALERKAIGRILSTSREAEYAIKMPDLSAIDYILGKDQQALAGIEIKTRKEADDQVKAYGGLMLKHRKLLELQQISEVLRLPCYVAFLFDNADGHIYLLDVSKITDPTPVTPPPRRNFRDLACDEEPVIYLDWRRDLIWLV